LLGLTTTRGSDWRDKVEEIKELDIKELALFPTMLTPQERQELYRLLEMTPLNSIPYVHLRDDFTVDEIDMLIAKYKTKVFSIHANQSGYALLNRLPKYNSLIYVENPSEAKEYTMFNSPTFVQHQITGLCLDLSHYMAVKASDKKLALQVDELVKKFPIGVNHVSSFSTSAVMKIFSSGKSKHHIDSLTELDYLQSLPANYFSKYVCIELENSLLEQKEVKQFLEMILEEKLK
jgi:hypothetical protein